MSQVKHALVAVSATGLGLRGSRAVGTIWKAFFDFAGMPSCQSQNPDVAVPLPRKGRFGGSIHNSRRASPSNHS